MESADSKPTRNASAAKSRRASISDSSRKRKQPAAVTIRDVAERSGFSSATVSIVLNNAPLARYIPDTTKGRIHKAAQHLGYRPNLFARSLRGRENPLYQSSFLPILTDVHNERSRFERYLEMLLDRRIEGLVVLANWLFVDINVLADLEKNNIPTVTVGRELKNDNISSVIVDNNLGARAALEHLYSLGHRKIAFIRGPRQLSDTEPRWRGVRTLAREHDLELNSRLIVDLPESGDPFSSFEQGYKLTEDLLHRRRPFTALMAFDDMTAFGAIRALAKAGIRVPDQCSVVGFDDVSPAAIYSPALTTVRQPMEVMGTAAATLVLEAINAGLEKKPTRTIHRRIVPELIVRESTRNVK